MNSRKERFRKVLSRIEQHIIASEIMIVGFAAAILLGGFLLSLPICNAKGSWLNFMDALFTSCTCVCVTGLITIVPATQFTLLGKVIMLLLIQFGGLGIIACTMGTFLLLRKQITLRSRVVIQESYNLNTLTGIIKLLRYVLKGTFLAEGVGACFYAFQFIPEFGFWRGIWYSVFHAVSAFCNAGIDLLGETSFQGYQKNWLINGTTSFLIILSGLGFLVWQDLWQAADRILKKEQSVKRAFEKMKLQTKLTVLMTLILVVGGTVAFFVLENSNPQSMGGLTLAEKWQTAMFQSVTTRTAGFFTVPQNLLREESRLLSCILMFIGGSPGGTAGGVKTTTIAILLITCWSVLKGSEDTVCFRRRIPSEVVRTGFSVFTVAFLAVIAGTFAIVTLEQASLLDALYEVVSAVGTVGLTTGLTPELCPVSKFVLILLMYMGRLGPTTLALVFAGKVGKKRNKIKLPEERIMVG